MQRQHGLFEGLSEKEIEQFIEDSGAKKVAVREGEPIFLQGEKPDYLYILLSGSIAIDNVDRNGKRTLVNIFKEADTVFGEVYLYLKDDVYDFGCNAHTDCSILQIPKEALFYDSGCNKIRLTILNNMLAILAKKAYFLNQKLLIVNAQSLRQKLVRYILQTSGEGEKLKLIFNREEMANFFGVARPSLSRELMNMQNEGLLEVDKNIITFERKTLENLI